MIKPLIYELAQLFETNKPIVDESKYTLEVVADFVRERVKRLIAKYRELKLNNEEF